MDETPDKNIEKLLSDYADQRRKTAGSPRMHPATRRMLQAEVARCLGTPNLASTEQQTLWWNQLWSRIALACGACALMGILIYVAFPPKQQPHDTMTMARMDTNAFGSPAPKPAAFAEMAKNGEHVESNRLATVRTAPAELKAPNLAKANHLTGEERFSVGTDSAGLLSEVTRREGSTMQPAPAAPLIAAKGSGGTEMPGDNSGNRGVDRADAAKLPKPGKASSAFAAAKSAAPTTPPAVTRGMMARKAADPAAPASVSTGTAYGQEFAYNALTQRFRNYEANIQVKDAPRILDEFTVELNGNEMKIVDNDGSIYKGYAEAAAVTAEQSAIIQSGWNFALTQDQDTNGRANVQFHPGASADSGQQGMAMIQQSALPAQHLVQTDALAATQLQFVPAAQNYNFRVEGTNRTLKQRTIITGNLIQNEFANTGRTESQAIQQPRQQQFQQLPLINQNLFGRQIQNNYINGRVVLGDSKTSTELNALSVEGQ